MFESTYRDAIVRFATVVVEVFGPQFVREPSVADTERLLAISEARGCPGLLGSLDYMHLNGRTAQKLYKGNIRAMLRSPASFSRQLHHMLCEFGTLSLA